METKLIKFKLYPEETPTHYVAGFQTRISNGRSFYTHTMIDMEDLNEDVTDVEIIQMALDKVEDRISSRAEELLFESGVSGLEIDMKNGEYEVRAESLQKNLDKLELTTEELREVLDVLLGSDD